MTNVTTERELVVQYSKQKEKVDELTQQLSEAKKLLEKTESTIIEVLNAKGAEKTAKYENIGHITLMKPRLYASYNKEDESCVFEYLQKLDRADIIKESVHPSSLSRLVKEKMEMGEPTPDFIKYYLKSTVRLYAS